MKHVSLTQYAEMKHIPSPKLAIYVTGALLLIGGIGVVLGVYVSFALLCLVLFLVPTTFIMHAFWKDTDPQTKMINTIQFTKNLALLGAVFMLFFLL